MQARSESIPVGARNGARQLRRFVAVGLVGLALVAVGLATDAVLHARDVNLAADEGLFTLGNPGHALLGLGIVTTSVGILGAASLLARKDGSGMVRAGLFVFGTGLVILVVSMTYAIAGPGLGHEHDHGIADAGALAERFPHMPREEAEAFIGLSLSRRGSLEGTHVHEHGPAQDVALSPDMAADLAEDLALAASIVPDFDTVEEAADAGFVPSSPHAEGVGVHWTKWSWVDQPFDAEKPSQLLFQEITAGEGPELVGLSYWVSSHHEPEGFAGEQDSWHQHFGLCLEDGIVISEGVEDRTKCAGDWINGNDLWMLHAWVVPGMENRNGVFANINPRLCEWFCE